MTLTRVNVVSYKCQQALWEVLPGPAATAGGPFSPLALQSQPAGASAWVWEGTVLSPLTVAHQPWVSRKPFLSA